MAEALVKKPEGKNLMIGNQEIFHVHQCGHKCNSPYCENVTVIDCENCGGPPRIQPGYEPWRGRM